MEPTWSSTCVSGYHGKYISANNHSSDDKDFDTLDIFSVANAKSKENTKDNSNLDTKSKHFNFDNLDRWLVQLRVRLWPLIVPNYG